MVSTRHHPRPFPEPDLPPSRSPNKDTGTTTSSSPTKTSTPPSPTVEVPTPRQASARRSTRKSIVNTTSEDAGEKKALTRSRSKRSRRSSSVPTYTHRPTSLTLTWLLGSLPLIFWDTGYVLLRPHTMPGGRYHSPVWTPYALYGTVDYMYGWPQWERGNGFTAAQGTLNAVEAAMYIYYLVVVFMDATDGWKAGVLDKLWREKSQGRVVVRGSRTASAVTVCFAAFVMTLSKTILYWLNEAFSNFENIGHNSFSNLFWLWIVPNGAWIVFPTYLIMVLSKEIFAAMHAAGDSEKDD